MSPTTGITQGCIQSGKTIGIGIERRADTDSGPSGMRY
jgi:hypothetical protein